MFSKFLLYFHTLRFLKPIQIYKRLGFWFIRPRIDVTPRPSLKLASGKWFTPAKQQPSLLDSDTFIFLNQSGKVSDLGWDGPEREKLWRYNQHYFDDLNAKGAQDRGKWHRPLLDSWVHQNPPPIGIGWEPYPTSLRIVNWIKWQKNGNFLTDKCLQSLAVQTRWLIRRVEWHLLGNHLFANAKALIFSGLFFEGPEAEKWLDTGLSIATQELTEQVLPDGGNFERSTMYHAIFLEDVLDLINLAGVYPHCIDNVHVDTWRECAGKMLGWLEEMCHPDGEISFFNDAAIGIASSPQEIHEYSRRLKVFSKQECPSESNVTVNRFTESGYIKVSETDAIAFLDVAPIGPDYLPGHAHADTLSFELSVFDQRIIVNGGTSQYGSGPVRLIERSTSSHNTVEVSGENSSEVWSGFRVARRAYPFDLDISGGDASVEISCRHNGYGRLTGRPIHKRTWKFSPGKLVVQDQVEGKFVSAVARFHFHPEIQITQIDPSHWRLNLPTSQQQVSIRTLKGKGRIEDSWHSPEFGRRLKSSCLAISFEIKDNIEVELSWCENE